MVIIVVGAYFLVFKPNKNKNTVTPPGNPDDGKVDISKGPKDLPAIVSSVRESVVLIKSLNRKGEVISQGTGFFINSTGHFISNRHVFLNAYNAEIKGVTSSYSIHKVLAESIAYDLVKLSVKISSKSTKPLPICNSIPKVGESILVIGNPMGLEASVSDGIVSAIRNIESFGEIIQITCPISPGSSGSPVLNMKGEVLGVATFQIREGQNLNFAVPIKRLNQMKVVDRESIASINYTRSNVLDSVEDPLSKGMILFSRNEFEGAVDFFLQAIDKDPQNAEAHYYLGICYRETHATNAIDSFKKAIELKPDYAEAYCHLGITYTRLNMHNEAVTALKTAIRLKPDYDEALLNLGIAYTLFKQYQEASEILEKALDIRADAKGYYYLGASYAGITQYDRAIFAFRKAIDIKPDYIEAYLGLGISYGYEQDWTRGIEVLNKAVVLDPQNPDIHFYLGMMHLGNKDLESATIEYEILQKQGASHKFLNDLSDAISRYKQQNRISD